MTRPTPRPALSRAAKPNEKQSLLAFMNGAMPQVAIEHGRKAISAYERPTINEVESATMGGGVDRRAGSERRAA